MGRDAAVEASISPVGYLGDDTSIEFLYLSPPDIDKETVDDYWERLKKLPAREIPVLQRMRDIRVERGCQRRVPIGALTHLWRVRGRMRATCLDVTQLHPSAPETVSFSWHVEERDRGHSTIIRSTAMPPDVNDWKMLARFFHKNLVQAAVHEIGEMFTFADQRLFDPHAANSEAEYERQLAHLDVLTRLMEIEYHRKMEKYDHPR